MIQEKDFLEFIDHKRKIQSASNCWSCSNVVLLSFRFADFVLRFGQLSRFVCTRRFKSSFGVPLALLCLFFGALKWIRGAFEEGSKVMRRYMQLMNFDSSARKEGLVAPRTYVHEAMNMGSQ